MAYTTKLSRRCFALFCVFVFAVTAIVTPLLRAVPASAEEINEKTRQNVDHIKSWLYYKASLECFKDDEKEYNAKDVEKNELGSSNRGNDEHIVGAYIVPGSGSAMKCNDIVKEGLTLWGYGSLEELLTDAGYTKSSKGNGTGERITGSAYYPNGKTGKDIIAAIEAKTGMSYAIDGPGSLDDVQLYMFYEKTFTNACGVTWQRYYDAKEEDRVAADNHQNNTVTVTALDEKNLAHYYIATVGSPGTSSNSYRKDPGPINKSDPANSPVAIHTCDPASSDFVFGDLISQYADKVGKAQQESADKETAATTTEAYKNGLSGYLKELCGEDKACLEKYEKEIEPCVKEQIQKGHEYHDKTGKDATADELKGYFADCFARKTGLKKEDIIKALSGVDPKQIAEGVEGSLQGSTANGGGGEEEKQTKDCKIEEGVGWIVCPVINFLASINDFAYKFISSTFLETDKDIVQSDDLKAAWSAFRDVANVAFVIAFLIIVYSQITQAGLSNYGIKRMLPRLFIAALLVNVSFIFCQLAVDLSNMLGYSLAGFFNGFAVGSGDDNVSEIQTAGTILTWVAIAGVVLAAAAGIALAFLGPALMSSLLALLMIVLILVARKALIVILIAISPVAFVAYLLPNTEQWFKKWQKTFLSLLMLFPTVAVVFGGSRLAAKIIANAAGKEDWLLQITALAVASIPFFIVPSLLQKSMEAAGTLGGKLTGLSQAANQRAGKAVKEKSALGRYKQAWDLNRKQKQARIFSGDYQGGKRNFLANAASRGFRKFNQGKHGPFKGTRQTAGQQAAEQVKKLNIDKVEAAKAQIEQANLDSAALARLASGESVGGINGKDKYAQAAAASAALDRGDHEAAAAGWDSVAEADQSTRNVFADAMSASDSRPAWMTAGEIAEMRSAEDSKTKGEGPTVTKADGSKSGIHKYDEMAKEQIKQNVYSPQRMAAASRQELEYARKVTSNDPEAQQKLKDTAEKVVGDEKLSRGLGKNSEAIQGLANLTVTMPSSSTPPPPAAPPAASGGGLSPSTSPTLTFTPRGSGGSGGSRGSRGSGRGR